RDVGLAEITVVRRCSLRRDPHLYFHFLQHRDQLFLVVGFLRHRRPHDDLRVTVHRRLGVIGLHKFFRRSVLHDPGFRIGKIPLRLRLGLRLLRVRRLRWPPPNFRPRSRSCFSRSFNCASTSACFFSAASFASCSSAAFASRIFSIRLSRRASSFGSSSPRFPFPYFPSSSASTRAASASSTCTSAASSFSAFSIRP